MKFIEFEELDSTNDYIKRNINDLDHFTIVQSHYQKNGKGRNGHIWESEKGENLLLSFLLKEFDDVRNIHQITQVAALAICNVLQEYQISAQIKWPNDIFVNHHKIAGILVEAVFEDSLQGIVIGVGLNVNTDLYQSISNYTNQKIDIVKIREKLIKQFELVYTRYTQGKYPDILSLINQYSYLKDKWVIYQEYGKIQFLELLVDGTLVAIDQYQNRFQLHVNEISLHQK